MDSIRKIHALEAVIEAATGLLRTHAIIREDEVCSTETCDSLGTLAVNLRLLATEAQATAEACDAVRKHNRHGRFA